MRSRYSGQLAHCKGDEREPPEASLQGLYPGGTSGSQELAFPGSLFEMALYGIVARVPREARGSRGFLKTTQVVQIVVAFQRLSFGASWMTP